MLTCRVVTVLLLLIPLSVQATTPAGVSFQDVLALPAGKPDSIHAYGADPFQFGQLWLPAATPPSDGFPLVVLVHGGCWLNAFDVGHLAPASTALNEAGYAVWAPEYRRVGDTGGGWPGSLNDIPASLVTLASLENASLNLDRVALAGHSAGGHLALLAALKHSSDLSIRSVVGLAAITDIKTYANGENSCEQATIKFMGSDERSDPAEWTIANPASAPTPANTTLLTGGKDNIVTPPQGQLQGADSIEVDDAGHFDFIHPGTRAWHVFIEHLASTL